MSKLTPSNITPRVARALKWIVGILEEESIEYQILGGLSASFYGASRPINDIDIDIQEKDFPHLLDRVRPYVQFGPELFIDSEWIVFMMALRYKGQVIEITNAGFQRIFDDASSEWKTFRYTLDDTFTVDWSGKRIRLMNPGMMIKYKSYLHGEKQTGDIETIKEFIRNNN